MAEIGADFPGSPSPGTQHLATNGFTYEWTVHPDGSTGWWKTVGSTADDGGGGAIGASYGLGSGASPSTLIVPTGAVASWLSLTTTLFMDQSTVAGVPTTSGYSWGKGNWNATTGITHFSCSAWVFDYDGLPPYHVYHNVRAITNQDPPADWSFDLHCNWSCFYLVLKSLKGTDPSTSWWFHSNYCTNIWLYGNMFFAGDTASDWTKLQSIQGSGFVEGSAAGITSLRTISTGVKFGGHVLGDLDFSGTALTAETIENWVTSDYFRSDDNLGGYFKTIRLEGGTVAAYEDLSPEAKAGINALQDLGYTIVMNGTGDSSTVNISSGNAALIITRDDGKYVPIKANSSDAIFPPTGYTNITEYATVGDALSAILVNLPDFDGTRLYGKIMSSNDSAVFVQQSLGTSVTLDATVSNSLPAGTTISYTWYKQVEGKDVEIPNANSATLSTSSLTSDQLGYYSCRITLESATTKRSMSIEKVFVVSEPETPVSTSLLMGSNSVDAVSIVDGGTGYSDATDVAVTGGSGSDLTLDITTTAGVITGATVNFPGQGYTEGDNVTVSGGNADAIIDVTVN